MRRREFLTAAAGIGLSAAWAGARAGAAPKDGPEQKPDQPPGKPLVIDCHAHLHHHGSSAWEADDRKLIEAADKLGIDQLCCSILTPRRPATVEGFQECNQWMADGMRRFPGRVLGYCYINPGAGQPALDEIRRCVVDQGFMGIKLYNEHTCTEPVLFPLVELAIELGVPILQHAGHMNFFLESQPHLSDGGHLAELARRYPEAMLICGHVGGGGDWQWTIKALRNAPTVCLDTSGSVVDEGIVEMAVGVLGADRVLFACDNSMTAGMGKMIGADLPEADKQKILGGNMAGILSKRRSR
jgi:hypothetical protein